MKKYNERIKRYELIWYEGTLDFPCDLCNTNSYKNFHIKVDNGLTVVCEKCLAEAKLEFMNELTTKEAEDEKE